MVIDSERMISTNIKLPVISLSVVKAQIWEKTKNVSKVNFSQTSFLTYNRSYCYLFQSIVNKSHKVLFCAFLYVELHVHEK